MKGLKIRKVLKLDPSPTPKGCIMEIFSMCPRPKC